LEHVRTAVEQTSLLNGDHSRRVEIIELWRTDKVPCSVEEEGGERAKKKKEKHRA